MATPEETLSLAAQYLATGNLAAAEQYVSSVLNEEPNHAEALHMIGVIAHQKGKLDQAIVYLNRSLTAYGANGFTWQHAGDVLLAAGDIRGGITYYEQALRLRPGFAEGYNTLGLALQRLEEWARAAQCFEQSTRLAPTFAPAFNNLGTTLRSQGKWAEAVAAFEHALKLWPDNPDITFNLANTFYDQGNLDQAIACFRRVLDLKPSYTAEVFNSLATALRNQGLWEESIAHYQETLKFRPDHAMAISNLSELAAAGRYTFPSGELDRVKSILASGRSSDADQILCARAVANVLDMQGAYDEAFDYYQQANDVKKRILKKRNTAFDVGAHETFVSRIMAEYGQPYFDRVKKWGTRTDLPLFIVGMPYSGLALVEQVLAGHPKIFRAAEIDKGNRLIAQVRHLPNVRAARQLAADYLQDLARHAQGAARVTVKNRDNYLALGGIGMLFPGARVIYCRRDPLDMGLSCFFQNFQDMAFGCSLEDFGAFYLAFNKLMAHWSLHSPVSIHEVSYEELIQNPSKTCRELITFCGLEWDEGCSLLDSGSLKTANGAKSRAGNPHEAIGRWRHYQTHLVPLIRALNLQAKDLE